MKLFIKKLARSLGYEIKRYSPATSQAAQLRVMLAARDTDLIIDVGANTGQFTRYIRMCGYMGRIISFEPLSSAHEELLRNSKNDSLWQVAPRMAIGSEDGEVEINISHNTVSSSIMPMMDRHVEAAPESKYVGVENTTIAKLDTAMPEYIDGARSVFLKIDTQGYEKEVLDGARNTLPIVNGIQIELSTVPLYEGSLLMVDMIKMIESLGFELHGFFPEFNDPKTGKMLQADGLFFRK